MTRAELEAAIWQAMKTYRVTCLAPVRFTDAVLRAADGYAAAEAAVTGQRRRDLAAAVRPATTTVHFGTTARACGGTLPNWQPALTTDPARVTCGRCKNSGTYRRALAEAS